MPAESTTTAAQTAPRRRVRAIVVAALLVTLHGALGLWCARRNSVTFDEHAHLPAGLAYWRENALPIYDLSPPLPRYWEAAPAAFFGNVTIPPTRDVLAQPTGIRHWSYAIAFMRANASAYHDAFLAGRAMTTLLSCVGCAIAFFYARSLAGDAAGMAACALFATCPNLVAHGSIVGTDSPAAVALLAATWLLDRYARSPTPTRAIAMTLALAVAPMVKFSLLPAWPLAAVVLLALAARRRLPWRSAIVPIALLPIAGFVVCWLSYAGQRGGASLAEVGAITSTPMAWLDAHGLGGIARAFPRPLVDGFDAQLKESAGEYSGYLFGRAYRGAAWGYYPTALLCKWTLGLLALCGLAIVVGVRRRSFVAALPAFVGIGYAIAFTSTTQINIGSRYLLPAIPLAMVAATATSWRSGSRKLRRVAGTLVVVAAAEGIASMPNPLGFYNAGATIVGAPGRAIIDDDWGQSLVALREWMTTTGVDRVRLAYVGRVDPRLYGIVFDDVADDRSKAEWLVFSSALASGTPALCARSDGSTAWIAAPSSLATMLREQSPDATVGALRLYRIEATAPVNGP